MSETGAILVVKALKQQRENERNQELSSNHMYPPTYVAGHSNLHQGDIYQTNTSARQITSLTLTLPIILFAVIWILLYHSQSFRTLILFDSLPPGPSWLVRTPSNNLFTGRADDIAIVRTELSSALRKSGDSTVRCFVITGMGGIGKSELSLKVVESLRSSFWGIFWVDVGTSQSAEADLAAIARKLGSLIPSQRDAARDALTLLANTDRPWLLILDNVDNLDQDYQCYFPSATVRGAVLMTSRNPECAERYGTIGSLSLNTLSGEDARNLFFRAARIDEDKIQGLVDPANDVANLLGYHPLALIQAGTYIRIGHCELSSYRNHYERQRKRVMTFRGSQHVSRYKDIYATLEASASELRTLDDMASRDAFELLSILSQDDRQSVPMQIFESAWKWSKTLQCLFAQENLRAQGLVKWNVEWALRAQCMVNCHLGWTLEAQALVSWYMDRLPALLQPYADEWDSFRLVNAVNILSSMSIITELNNPDTKEKQLNMHSVVQAWVIDRQVLPMAQEAWMAMAITVIFANDNIMDRSRLGQKAICEHDIYMALLNTKNWLLRTQRRIGIEEP